MKLKIQNFFSKWSLLFLVLVVTFGYFFWPKVEMVSFKVPRGQIKIVTLPDSSEIILNAESSLKYDSTKFQQKREVILCGEAYFKIKLGKPFFVKSDFVTTKTFGASFNVRFRGKKVQVSCLTGKVSVQANRNKDEVGLASGYQTSVYKNSGPSLPKKIDLANTISWTTGEFTFKDTPLLEVFAEIERHFDIRLKMKKRLANLTFTGRIKNSDIDYALNFVSLAAGLKYDSVNDSTFVIY